jgi:hypothetical protein
MLRESREYERKPLLTPEEENLFFIEIDGVRYPLDNVKDISVSGAGIQLTVPLIPTSPVVVGFEQDEQEVRVQGAVVWCQELAADDAVDGHQPRYRLGIRFNPMDLKNSSALFLALREYIDPFGTY